MRFVSKILVIVNLVLLVGVAVLLSVGHVFSSSVRMNSALEKAGVYHELSKSVQDNFRTNLAAGGVSDPLVIASVNKVITPAQIEKLLQPVIMSFVDWLGDPQTTDQPRSSIDLTGIKSDLANQFAADLDAAKAAALNFEVTKDIPDNIDLMAGAQIAPTASGDAAKTQSNQANDKTLNDIKSSYTVVKSWFWPMVLGVAAATTLLFVLNLRRGRERLTKIVWSFAGAGLITLGLGFGSPLLSSGAGNGQEMSQTFLAILPILLEDTRVIGIIYGVIAVVLLLLALVLLRPAGKKKN